MRNSTLLISLLLSLSACNQAPEQNKDESPALNQVTSAKSVTKQNVAKESTDSEEIKDSDHYPQFFIEVAKNLNISTQAFAQAMKKAGDNNASMESVAKELGISIDDLQAALPKRPPRKITFEPADGVEIVQPVKGSKPNANVSE